MSDNKKNMVDEDAQQVPEASFRMLVTTIGSQAMIALGQLPNPMTGEKTMIPDIARHHIDTLGMLKEKTTGNLSTEEQELIDSFSTQLMQLFLSLESSGFPTP